MPDNRQSLKPLVLIAAGLALVALAYVTPALPWPILTAIAIGWYLGFALIGVGLLLPFGKPWIGAIAAVMILLLVLSVIAVQMNV
jgi:hypothetical protein